MKRSFFTAFGAFHPIIFFLVVYGISLFMAFFVCTVLYNNIYSNNNTGETKANPDKIGETALTADSSLQVTAFK
jgi:hypothetical protein